MNKVEGRGVQLEADEEVCRVQLRAKAQVDVIRQNADHHKAVIDVRKQQRMGERTDKPPAKLPHATVLASASSIPKEDEDWGGDIMSTGDAATWKKKSRMARKRLLKKMRDAEKDSDKKE